MTSENPPSAMITVLTPTYNRAHVLGRIYDSLRRQTYNNFEWLIVDDGSDDETKALVRSWMDRASIDIRYRVQANRGKHVAVNRGVELARGEFTSIVDSDDWFPPTALEVLVREWEHIPASERASFSGVVGLCAFEDGRIIGDRYPTDPLDCDSAQLRYVHGVKGDKHALLRTSVLREYPFPFEESKHIIEALVWNRMALKYRQRHINEVVLAKEYLRDGMTYHALALQIEGAPATRQFYLEELTLPRPLKRRRRLRSYVNYVRFSLHANLGWREQAAQAPSKAAWLAAGLPVGTLLYLRDRAFAS
jgi:glycosyltransferase involved in cell wall biosynthesis